MPEPTKIPRPFADSGDKNSIPDSSGSIGFASWQEGFPVITGTPFSQGGVAPKRADFNGIFNAISAATVWAQQGGVYAYDATTDYEVGNVVEYNGDLYKCLAANGPSSAVKAPTDASIWAKVILTTATASAAGYMSAADKILVDTIPDLGTFSRMFFSQTSGSYTAPYTGVYRITLKGGGGGGGGQGANMYSSGGGGGEGGTLTFYTQLAKNQSYAYTVGAGGLAGANSAAGDTGGTTGFTTDYRVWGGYGGLSGDVSYRAGGSGGNAYAIPTGEFAYFVPGARGVSGILCTDASDLTAAAGGGNGGGRTGGTPIPGIYGGGGGGGILDRGATAGGDGYILIEYAG